MSSNSSSQAVANLVIEPGGTLMALWPTVFVFGNLFAFFWLIRAFLNAHPEIAYQVGLHAAKLGLGRLGIGRRQQAAIAQKRRLSNGFTSSQHTAEQAKAVVTRDDIAAAAVDGNHHVAGAALLAESGASLHPGPIATRISADSTGSARKHQHRHRSHIDICTPSGELLQPQSPSAASAASSSPRKTLSVTNGHVAGLEVVRSDSPEGSDVNSFSSSLSDDDDMRQPVELEWLNMCYSVRTSTGKKYIVQGIYGNAKPGQLQGLMGPSGAGKSTLMDLLAMRTPHDAEASAAAVLSADTRLTISTGAGAAINGIDSNAGGGSWSSQAPQTQPQLLLNGMRMRRRAYMNISAYVPQHDNLVPTMTAYEAVSFYASIILPYNTSKAAKEVRIARVLRIMGLTEQQHTLVGGFLPGGIMLRGMSGGERKRLAIACGVVAGPSLVFLDEPTSGLDSFAALNVVLFLKSMATERGASLLASLHQPRAAIWSQLDQVTLLASGRLMYTGPTDDLVPWFKSLGYYHDLQEHGVASDWALDLVALGFTKPEHLQGTATSAVVDAPAGTEEQQSEAQQPGSVRYRGVGLAPPSAAATSSPQLQRQPSMMSSQQELVTAAEAFQKRLQEEHPEWFHDASAASAGVTGASTSTTGAVYGAPAFGSNSSVALRGPSSQSWWKHSGPPMQQASADGQHQHTANDVANGVASDQDAVQPQQAIQQKLNAATAQVETAAVVNDAGPFAQRRTQQNLLVAGHEKPGLCSRILTALHKYRALFWRELLITTRNPADVGGRMMTFTYVAMISGIVSWNLPGDAGSMFNRLSVCYAVLTFYFLMPFVFMSIFTSDKKFFAADTTARLYHPAQYYLSKVTVTLPFNIVVAIVFHLIYYGMTGMRHGAQYMAMSCFVCTLTGLIGMQAIYCCAVLASSQDLAFVLAIAFTALNLLVNPYMAVFSTYSLGWGFSWLRFFSPCNFAWQALIQVEFGGRGFDCNHGGSGLEAIGLYSQLLPRTPTSGPVSASQQRLGYITNQLNDLSRFSNNGQCIASGDAVVEMYTAGLTFAQIAGVLIGYLVLFMVATYLVVRKSAQKQLKA